MKRRVQINLGGRVFSLVSDEPEDITSEVKARIESMYREFSNYDGVPTEDLLFVMLANAVLENVKLSRKIDSILKKMKETRG